MAEPRSPAGRAAAAAARNPAAPGAGPAPAAPVAGAPIAGAPAPGAPVPEAAGPAVSTAAAGSEAANLAAGEADAARVAEHRDGTDVLRAGSFAEAAAAFIDHEVPLPDGGPGVGAARVAERIPERFASRPIGTVGEELARAELREPRVPPISKDVLPRSEFRVDPDTVPGHRYATAATQLRRNGRTYQPGVEVKVDYRAYAQLVAVGAIVADPWHRLSLAADVEVPVSEAGKMPLGGDAPKV